jgi:acetolactate synthase-1/2/3 large subunit
MSSMTGGQALVQTLKREGVEVVFGLPGVQMDWAFDALWEERESIRVIHTRNEQATSYMADGYARSTGKIGVCMMVPGPGLLNAMAGLSTAYASNSQVLCIAGQIATHHLGQERGALHEIKDQLDTIKAVTKWAARAMSPQEVTQVVHDAFIQLNTGRSRPVEIEVPHDIFARTDDVILSEPGISDRQAVNTDLLDQAAKLLGEADNPLIFVGGGSVAKGTSGQLEELSMLLQAPTIMSPNGKGALSSRHYLAHPTIAAYDLIEKADVILAIGTRFVLPGPVSWPVSSEQKLIRIDIDPEEINRNIEPDLSIIGDAVESIDYLAVKVEMYNKKRLSRQNEMLQIREKTKQTLEGMSPLGLYSQAIRDELPDDGILVTEMTQVGYYSYQGFPVYSPRTYITPGYQGTLGYGFSTALGVKVGNPDKTVISIAGDGGFMFGVQEMSTMVQNGINLITIVFNDGAYGNVRRTQSDMFGGRHIASNLENPDFLKLAESFGVTARRAAGPSALKAQIRESILANEPTLIEVPMKSNPSTFAHLAPPARLLP